jgi:aminoglycoside 6'-N-acetyltransferase I
MRRALWPDSEAEEVDELLAGQAPRTTCYLAVDAEAVPLGFAELGLRAYAEGCATSPVAYLEGIWVDPAARRAGAAAALVRAAARWADAMGCRELASDTDPGNAGSLAFHRAVGFEEAGRSVCFHAHVHGFLR